MSEERTLYKEVREDKLGWSREKAAEMTNLSVSQLERIENGKQTPKPDEVLSLIQAYNAHELCNYYCTSSCELGMRAVRKVEQKALTQIVIKMLASIHRLGEDKQRLVDIAEDEIIASDELNDFALIESHLNEMLDMIYSLQLWIKNESESIDEQELKQARLNLE